jgi:hypothetical protein
MIKNRGDRWTTEEINLTKDLYQQGFIFDDIAAKVNHSANAVGKKLKELGLTGNRRVLWTDEDLDRLRDLFNQGLPYSEIAQKLGKTVRACQGKAVRIGLKTKECNAWINNTRSDFWSDSEISVLKKCINDGMFMSEFVSTIGRSEKSIFNKMAKLGLRLKERTEEEKSLYRRAYSVDDNYFETIDSQKKAYWLGWLITDGFVLTSLNTKRGITNVNSIGLKLAEKDLCVLEDFKKDIKADVLIKYVKEYTPKAAYKNKITGKEIFIKGGAQYSLRFTSAKMIQDLAKYGIHQNKTYDVVFPKELDSKYYPGFIAGVISGDGCIDLKKNHDKGYILRCTIAGNMDLVQKIKEILIKEICMNPDKKFSKCEATKCLYRLELNQTETLTLYYWLQKNGISLMERKNKLIEEFLDERVKIPA